MPEITMYTTQVCPYCRMAEQLLQAKGVAHINKVYVDQNPALRTEMLTRTQRKTVPQIYIGEFHVGGYDDLVKLDQNGQLNSLLMS